MDINEHQVDVVIAGSGPGGATLARELLRRRPSLKLLLLERGRDWRDHPLYGTYPGAMLYTDRASFLATASGISIVRPLMLGGATSMFCACAADPLPWWKERYGVDLEAYAAETRRELHVAPLPPQLRGRASTRIAEAADSLGHDWLPQDKFMSPDRADPFSCGATCMLGCRCGAKWNAAEYVDQARLSGAFVWTGARVQKVVIDSNQAAGVIGFRQGQPFLIRAGQTILAAGGIGTARLLQASGVDGAGEGMTLDTTVIVYGHAPFRGNGNEPPMTWSYADDELGVMYSSLIDPWLNYPLAMLRKGPTFPLSWRRWGRTLGVMIKLKDEVSGRIEPEGPIHKDLTAADRDRLSRAESVAIKILVASGCDPDSIFSAPPRGTHPSGTARLGAVVDSDLKTAVKNLYVCDASVFPEALARPTVLTIIALAKRLAAHLTNESRAQ